AFVWTVNMFTFANNPNTGLFDPKYCLFDHVQVIAMKKDGTGVNQVDLSGWNGTNIVNENLMPVRMHDAVPSDPMLFAEETNYAGPTQQNNSLTLLTVPNILTATASSFVASTLTVPTYNYILAPAPPGADDAWNIGDRNSYAQQNTVTTNTLQTNDT